MPLLATTPSPFAPELNGRPAEPEGPGEVPATVGLDVAGMAERIVPFPVAAGRYDKLRAAKDGVVWLELPRAGELGETVIGAAGEQDGTWRIARILPGESSVIGARSPLAAPGVAAAPGDLIVAVDGRPVDPDLGPNALLAGKADKPVELTLARGGADRRAVVVPLASEHAARRGSRPRGGVATRKLAGQILQVVPRHGLSEPGSDPDSERVAADAGEMLAEQVRCSRDMACGRGAGVSHAVVPPGTGAVCRARWAGAEAAVSAQPQGRAARMGARRRTHLKPVRG